MTSTREQGVAHLGLQEVLVALESILEALLFAVHELAHRGFRFIVHLRHSLAVDAAS